jgi:peptidylprolyl isomerase
MRRRPRSARPVLLLIAIALVAAPACGDDGDKAGSLGKKPKVKVPEGAPPTALTMTDLIKGTGAEAVPGKKLSMQYVGVSYSDKKQFDASWDRGDPFTFTLGAGEVIKGWDQGVPGMKVGGRRMLIIPPDLGYGARGAPPDIKPNETLVFVIDLVSVS